MKNERIIRHAYDEYNQRCTTPAGRRIADKMSVICGNSGERYLEKTGETDLYSYIQSFREEVDLKKIIERCMISGDISMLQRVQGVYMDVTGMPADTRTAHDILNHSRQVYESLDSKVKAHYQGFDDFLEAFANEENFKKFIDLAQMSDTSSSSIDGEEVVQNEQKQ